MRKWGRDPANELPMDLGPFHLEVVKHLSTASVAQQGVACRRHLPRLWLGLLTD